MNATFRRSGDSLHNERQPTQLVNLDLLARAAAALHCCRCRRNVTLDVAIRHTPDGPACWQCPREIDDPQGSLF